MQKQALQRLFDVAGVTETPDEVVTNGGEVDL